MGGWPNFHLYSGISSLDGYDQFEPSNYLSATYAIGGEHAASYGSGTNEERTERLLSRLDVFGMMAGRYIVSGVPLDAQGLFQLGAPTISEYKLPLYVYEYRAAHPIFYLATTTIARPHSSFKELYDSGETFEVKTFLDCTDCATRILKPATLSLIERANGRYVFNVTTKEARHLVLSESFLPGWTVQIDSIPVAPIRANGIYMAVSIPEGEHRVEFEFQGLMNELTVLKALRLVRNPE